MITIITLDNRYAFNTNNEAIDFIKANNLLTYTIQNDLESFTFFGGKLLLANTPQIVKFGNFVARKI